MIMFFLPGWWSNEKYFNMSCIIEDEKNKNNWSYTKVYKPLLINIRIWHDFQSLQYLPVI